MPDKWLFYVWGLRFKKSWCEACTSCRITSEEFRVTANYIESVTQDSHVGNLTIVVQKFYVLPYLFLNIHDFQGTLKLSREPTTSRCSLLQHWTPTLALLIGGYFWIHFVPDLFLTKLVRFFNVEWRDSPPTRVRSPLITARPNDLRPHLIELTHSPLSALKSYKIFERSGFTINCVTVDSNCTTTVDCHRYRLTLLPCYGLQLFRLFGSLATFKWLFTAIWIIIIVTSRTLSTFNECRYRCPCESDTGCDVSCMTQSITSAQATEDKLIIIKYSKVLDIPPIRGV